MTSVSEYLCAKTKYMVRLMCLKEMQVDALTSLVLNLKKTAESEKQLKKECHKMVLLNKIILLNSCEN